MMPIGVALAIMGFVFLIGALTHKVSEAISPSTSTDGPPAAVMVGSYGLLIAGLIVIVTVGGFR